MTQEISDLVKRRRVQKKKKEKNKNHFFICSLSVEILFFRCYISRQPRLPFRCLALEFRPSFIDEDLFPLLFEPLPPFLFFRPLRSLRVRSFYKKKVQTE